MSEAGAPSRVSHDPRAIAIIAFSLMAGLGIRIYYVARPPAPSTKWDHHEYVRWGMLMQHEGFAALYDHPPPESLMWDAAAGRARLAHHPEHFVCNYPPLAAYLLYAEMAALRRFDSQLVSNTPAARAIYASLGILGDVLIAAGCFAIVRRLLRNERRGLSPPSSDREGITTSLDRRDEPGFARAEPGYAVATPGGSHERLALAPPSIERDAAWMGLAPAVAFAAVMLAPPFFFDSARWTQTDSWVLAPAVWMLWAMLPAGSGPRWLTAGLLWGVALGLKTQAVLFAPVWLFALALARPRRKIILAMVIAMLVLAAASIPFTAHSGLKWFNEAYVNNLFESYKLTTLHAFNLWYLDLLVSEDTNAGCELLGWEKDTWGRILLVTAVLASAALLARRRARPDLLVAFAATTMLAAVILPTRVHERYILLPIPFLIVLAAMRPKIWLALVPFIIVASFQMTVLDWLGLGAGTWSEIAERFQEQYEAYRQTLPPDQAAALPLPKEDFDARRAALGREKWEWILTLTELTSAAFLFVLSIRRPARRQSE